MDSTELLEKITAMYGEPKITHANGVYVLAVAIMGGVAVGCGSTPANAVWDLHCELCLPSARETVTGIHRKAWEVDRRSRIDQALKG